MAHLPPTLARQERLKITFSAKMLVRAHAEGGQVQPVVGRYLIKNLLSISYYVFPCQKGKMVYSLPS